MSNWILDLLGLLEGIDGGRSGCVVQLSICLPSVDAALSLIRDLALTTANRKSKLHSDPHPTLHRPLELSRTLTWARVAAHMPQYVVVSCRKEHRFWTAGSQPLTLNWRSICSVRCLRLMMSMGKQQLKPFAERKVRALCHLVLFLYGTTSGCIGCWIIFRLCWPHCRNPYSFQALPASPEAGTRTASSQRSDASRLIVSW